MNRKYIFIGLGVVVLVVLVVVAIVVVRNKKTNEEALIIDKWLTSPTL